VSGWSKPAEQFAAPLAAMLEQSVQGGQTPDHTLVLVLENAAGLEGTSDATASIGSWATALVGHASPRVRAAAVRVLGSTAPPSAYDTIRARLLAADEDVRVRREAAAALTAVAGDAALPDLDQVSQDVAMTTLVVRHLRDFGTEKAIPLLERIRTKDRNADTRVEARKAVEKIRDRARKKRSGE
jgi:HEAT repeat protein